MLQRLLLILFFLSVSKTINAAPYQLKNSLPVLQQLLPEGSGQIVDIKKDINGLIWIADGSRLYSFDGVELKQQAVDLNVMEIYASPTDSYLLLGTADKGLYRFDLQSTELVSINYGAHGEALQIDSLEEDNSSIYIGTLNGLYVYDKGSLQGTPVKAPMNVLGSQIRELLWVKDKLAVAYAPVKMGKKIGGVYFLNNDLSWSKNLLPDGMTDVWDMYFDNQKEYLWLASSNAGLFKISTIDNKRLNVFNKDNGSLLSNTILSITGYNNVVLAGDFHNGLIKIQGDKVEYFKSNDFFPKNIDDLIIRELYYEPESQQLVMGLQAGGIVSIDIAEQGIEYFRESIINFSANNIWALAKLSDKTLVLGVYGHGLQLHPVNGKPRLINLDPNGTHVRRNHIKKIIQLNELELLVGTLGAGVLKVNLLTGEAEPTFAEDQVVTDLLTDEQGLVVASLGGVQKWSWQGEPLFSYNNTDIIDSDKYFSVISHKNSLILGTNGGILLMSQKGIPIRKVEGCGKAVAQIIQLDEHWIAAATASGMCVFSPDGKVLLTIESRDIISMVWDPEKSELWGFGEDIVHHNFSEDTTDIFDAKLIQFIADKEAAAIALPQGFMVASSNGIALLHPKKVKPYRMQSRLILSNINTPMRDIVKGSIGILPPITLTAENNSINLEIREINFRKNKSELSYRLLSDKNEVAWSISPSRFINLNYLSVGEYQLQLKLSSTAEQDITLTTPITVLAPWYLTFWAWVSYTALLVISLIGFYIWRVHSIKLRNIILEQQVSAKTTELQCALQEKDSLFENVSHELKTPLTLILGRSEQLLKRSDLNATTHNEVKHIEASAEHLYQLVNQILQLAEIKHQKQLKEPIDIISETNILCESLASLAQSSGMAITYQNNTALDTHWLELQQGAWPSIMTNLVSNAIKYGDRNFGVHVSLEVTETELILTVLNKGETIKTEQLEKIFNRFKQLDHKQKGQGLGLAIVKELLSNHCGSVSAKSFDNETIFTVILPNKENQISQREAIQPLLDSNRKVNSSTRKQRILVVEDNKELREFITSTLTMQFSVIAVEHGQAAIDWLTNAKELPDLILSDVMMPIMDGYELCQVLKQNTEYQKIPLFLLTAKADPQSIKKGLEYSADDYIAKPFNTDVLITKIGNQLATREAFKKHLKANLLTSPEKLVIDKVHPDSDMLLKKVNESLAENFCKADIKTADIAKALHMQEKTLNRKLQTQVGCSISQLLKEYRLNKAKQLLEKGHKSKTVCFDCGFNSVSYFGQKFKQQFGMTPSAYQQNHQTSQVE
jgi:signal transduction histidine kinase/AraC-like DNA-binding protein/WD40 repeat protein